MNSPKHFIMEKCNLYQMEETVMETQIFSNLCENTCGDTRDVMVETLKLLLNIVPTLEGRHLKSIIITVMFQFIIEFEGIFQEVLEVPELLESVVRKLIEFSEERVSGLKLLGDPFLEKETIMLKNLLFENNQHDLANRLEDILV